MRDALSIMAEIARAGFTPDQLALVLELTASVAAEARPAIDKAAENKRAYDRQYHSERRKNRTTSYESCDIVPTGEKEIPPDPQKKNTPLNGSPKGEPIPPPDAENDEPDLRPEHVLEAWNAMADRAGVPKAKLTPERRKKLSTFIRRHPVDDITEAISAVERSPFLRGENDRSWRADFNWMLEPRNFTKLTEGTYDR